MSRASQTSPTLSSPIMPVKILVWTSQIFVRASQTSHVVKSPTDVPPSNELSPNPGPDATPAGSAVDPGTGSVPSPGPGSVPAAVTELFSSSGDGSGTSPN